MKWESNQLLFRMYREEDQELKYVDQQSTHRPINFKSIATGVYTRLSRLTSYSESTAEKSIDEIYPEHAEALNAANLMKDKFPTFGEIWKNQANDVAMEEKKKKRKDNWS
eukprot:15228832-Ditylum_brightwellii.AAC.1